MELKIQMLLSWGSLKSLVFKEGFTKSQYIGGNCLKRGGLDSLQILRGLGAQEGVFLKGGVDTPTLTIVGFNRMGLLINFLLVE